jgi:hypothetical protein
LLTYVSQHNTGALGLTEEVSGWLRQRLKDEEEGHHPRRRNSSGHAPARRSVWAQTARVTGGKAVAAASAAADVAETGQVVVTQSIDDLDVCESMLVFLNGSTWTSGGGADAFAKEVRGHSVRGALPLGPLLRTSPAAVQ